MRIQDVARRAGVSAATVSRVFNAPEKVAAERRERVETVARELAYVPNTAARTLRTQRSHALGVVLPTLTNPVFAECLQGIAEAASGAGYSIVPFMTDYRVDREDRAAQLLLAGGADGLILVVSNPATSVALTRLAQAGLPYVLAYNQHPEHTCVTVDGEAAVAQLVQQLAGLGHRRIAMVTGQLQASDRAQQRCRGYHQGMAAAGLPAGVVVEVPFVDTAIGQITALLRRAGRPTAIVCSNDLLAIRCIRAAHLAGLGVPHDLSVAGFDGIALGQDLTPTLTSIAQPNAEIGCRSVELLLQAVGRSRSLTPQASVTLPWRLREGESCAPL